MSKLILAAALALTVAGCSKPAPPVDATPAAGGQAPSAQDGAPVQQK